MAIDQWRVADAASSATTSGELRVARSISILLVIVEISVDKNAKAIHDEDNKMMMIVTVNVKDNISTTTQ